MEFIVSTTGINVTLEDIGVTLTHPETRDLKDDQYGLADLLDSQDLEAALRAGTLTAQDENGYEIPSVAIGEWYERIKNNTDAIADGVDVSTGASDAGKLTKLDAGGQLDSSMVNEAGDEFILKGATSTADIRFRTSGTFSGFTIDKPNSASGFMSWFPNANVVQWFLGDVAAATGANLFYMDADNAGEMYFNVLPGAGRGGNVFISHSAAVLPGGDLVSDLGSPTLRWTNTYSQEFIGGGASLTGITPAQIGLNNTDDLPEGSTNLYFDEAPINGSPHYRQDGAWVVAPTGGGVSLSSSWKYNSSTSPNPSSGEFRLNNSNPNSATILYLSDETEDGFDFSNLIAKIAIGDIIYLQNGEDAFENAIYEVTSTTDSGSYYTFGVTVLEAGSTSFDDGKEFGVLFALGVAGGTTSWLSTGASDIKYELGNVGIGGDPDASCQLHLIDDTGRDLCVEQVGALGSAFISLRKANGTIAAKTAILSGEKIAGFDAAGYDGVAYESTAEVSMYATEDYNASARGSELRLEVTENGTTSRVTKFTVKQDGEKDFHSEKGINVADPTDPQDAATKNYVDQTHTITVNPDGTILGQRGAFPMSVNRISTGQYDITFDTPLADANYAIILSNQESLVNRDDIKALYDSRANTGFFVWIGEQDNGGTAGVYRDREFSAQIVKY